MGLRCISPRHPNRHGRRRTQRNADRARAHIHGPRRLSARLPRHLRDARHRRGTAARSPRSRAIPTIRPPHGTLCTKVARYLDRTYSRRPRAAPDASASAARAKAASSASSWDEALDDIATRFARIAASPTAPRRIVPYSYAGTMGLLQYGSMDRALLPSARRVAARSHDLRERRRRPAGRTRRRVASGMDVERSPNSEADHLIWGSNAITSNLHFWTRAQEAKRRGAKLVAIDPYRSATAEKCHEHIALLPGTDAALALGLMHVLIARRSARPRLHRALHARLRRARRARARVVRRSASPRICGIACRAGRAARARLRHDQAGGDPR